MAAAFDGIIIQAVDELPCSNVALWGLRGRCKVEVEHSTGRREGAGGEERGCGSE